MVKGNNTDVLPDTTGRCAYAPVPTEIAGGLSDPRILDGEVLPFPDTSDWALGIFRVAIINGRGKINYDFILAGLEKFTDFKFPATKHIISRGDLLAIDNVITSYSIHYTKLYDYGIPCGSLMHEINCINTKQSCTWFFETR